MGVIPLIQCNFLEFMKWLVRILKWLFYLILFVILLGFIKYLSSFDWNKKHTKKVEALPLFDPNADLLEQRIRANNKEFLVRSAGMKNSGSGILLLHGFPESSIMWKPLIKKASEEGYKVIAFDQRGYSPGARPKDIESYHIDSLVNDVISVADAIGLNTFHLVGHDWGSAVGWKVVMDHPERLKSWTGMAVSHTGVFFDGVLNHTEQIQRSSYMQKLRIPIIPEVVYRLFYNRLYKGLEGRWSNEQIEEYKKIFLEKGAFSSALNWYRAMDYEDSATLESLQKRIKVPTLFLWGENDPIITHELVPVQKEFMDTTYSEVKLDAGHSLMQEAEDEVLINVMKHINAFD